MTGRQPVLTIGCAHFLDFDGIYFTLESLAMYHDLSDVEIVVIDNSSNNKAHADAIRGVLGNVGINTAGVIYQEFPDAIGTTQSREQIFKVAHAPNVLCMDCHVMLPFGAVEKLKHFYQTHPDSLDLYAGPMLSDNMGVMATHFADHWRGQMWGTWATAWQCGCGPEGVKFDTWQEGNEERVNYAAVTLDPVQLEGCPHCGKQFPRPGWSGHEQVLLKEGYRRVGFNPDDAPFDIPAMGLGLFTCRKEAWLGFSPHFRGFGGEEMYIHHKYYKAGRKVQCLPFLQWSHRFARPNAVPYPLTIDDKVRNYVLGLNELELPLDRCYEHFVTSGIFPKSRWEQLVKDPIAFSPRAGNVSHVQAAGAPQQMAAPQQSACSKNSNGQAAQAGFPAVFQQPPEGITLDEGFEWFKTNAKRDLDQLMDDIKHYGEMCRDGVVTDFANRRESALALLAARPKYLRVYTQEPDALYDRMHRWTAQPTNEFSVTSRPNLLETTIEPCDLLYIDPTVHNAEFTYQVLKRHAPQVRRFILLRATVVFGTNQEGGQGNGMYDGMRRFLDEFPNWFIFQHTNKQAGYTVFGCQESERPPNRILPWPPGFGPGTELKRLLSQLGIQMTASCDCNTKAIVMDQWGTKGCQDNFNTIVAWLKEGQTKWKWDESLAKIKTRAAIRAIFTGIAFKINPFDPFPGLVREAIHKAQLSQGEHVLVPLEESAADEPEEGEVSEEVQS